MESHSNSIGTLLKTSYHGTWISCAIDIFEALDLLHTYMVDFGLDNLTFLHRSFFIYFSDILSLFVSLPFLLTMSLSAMLVATSSLMVMTTLDVDASILTFS
jgi:hypothetical protein